MVHFRIYIAHWVFFFIAFIAASAWTFVVATEMDANDQTDPANDKWRMYNYIAASVFAAFALISCIWGVVHTNKLKKEGYIDGLSPAEQAAWLQRKLSNKAVNELRTRLGAPLFQQNQQNNNNNTNNNNNNNANQQPTTNNTSSSPPNTPPQPQVHPPSSNNGASA